MALDSRELMLEKFVLVNKDRYPEFAERIAQVTVANMTFDTIAKDPSNPLTGRVSNLASEKLTIEAAEQSWECGLLNGPKVLNFTSDILYTSLEEILTNHSRGFFKYQSSENNEIEVIQILPTTLVIPNEVMNAALLDLNYSSNYVIKSNEITLIEIDDTGINLTFLVDGDTVYGKIKTIKRDPDKLIAGNWVEGYYGQVTPNDLISPEVLTDLLGIDASKIINQENNLWLKFSYNGKTILIAQKPTAKNVSYNELESLNLVIGNRIVTLKDQRYAVRIPKGLAADDYRELEDLLFHCSENDPRAIFWERFTDTELGVGSTGIGGEWNWIFKNQGNPSNYIKLGTGLLSEITTSPASSDLSRGFRPVLILDGVNGVETIVDLIEPIPKRLTPVNDNSFGLTDALPVKTVFTYLVPGPVYPTGWDFTDYVTAIRQVETSLYRSIDPAIYDGYQINDLIKVPSFPPIFSNIGIRNPIFENYTFGGETIYVIRNIEIGSGSNTPVYSHFQYGELISPLKPPLTFRPAGLSQVVIAETKLGDDTVYPIRELNIPGASVAPVFDGYRYDNLLSTLKTIKIKPPGLEYVTDVNYNYNSVKGARIFSVSTFPKSLIYTSKKPMQVIIPSTYYGTL